MVCAGCALSALAFAPRAAPRLGRVAASCGAKGVSGLARAPFARGVALRSTSGEGLSPESFTEKAYEALQVTLKKSAASFSSRREERERRTDNRALALCEVCVVKRAGDTQSLLSLSLSPERCVCDDDDGAANKKKRIC